MPNGWCIRPTLAITSNPAIDAVNTIE